MALTRRTVTDFITAGIWFTLALAIANKAIRAIILTVAVTQFAAFCIFINDASSNNPILAALLPAELVGVGLFADSDDI